MADEIATKPPPGMGVPITGLKWAVGARLGECWITFQPNEGGAPLSIPLHPQGAFEMGENLARAAHVARYGTKNPTDRNYLAQQIRARTTEQYRKFLCKRIETMLNSLREDKTWSNKKLAEEVVHRVLEKVT